MPSCEYEHSCSLQVVQVVVVVVVVVVTRGDVALSSLCL